MNVQFAGLPMLPWSSPPLCYDTQAQHIMSTPVIVLREVESVATVIRVLEETRHQGFPVRSEQSFNDSPTKPKRYGVLQGLILRSQLKILLKERAFSLSPESCDSLPPLPIEKFRMYYPRYPAFEVNGSGRITF